MQVIIISHGPRRVDRRMLNNTLNGVIRFSLQQRVLVAALAVFLMVYGGWQIASLPIDVFPSLDRPRVVVMTEAPGLAPEEVEALITFPLESALNGATGVQTVRTSSGIGLSVIYVEFDWGADIYRARQFVAERLQTAVPALPPDMAPPTRAPINSIMGEILLVDTAATETSKKVVQAIAEQDQVL